MPTNSLRSTFNNVRVGEENEFLCACGFQMKDFLVQKKTSPYYGTWFYACAKWSQDPTRCRTKIWFDEKESVRNLIPPAMKSPRTPRKQVDIRIFGQYTPPATSKRKANMPSFDSGVGELADNEPDSPSISRSTKKPRHGYSDAATQTPNTNLPAPAVRSAPRAMPRRRLFDDVLSPQKSKPATTFDPFTPHTLGSNRGSFRSSIASPVRQLQSNSPSPTYPITPPGKKPPAAEPTTSKYQHMNSPLPDNPETPPALKGGTAGLFARRTEDHARVSSPSPDADGPRILTKSDDKPKHQSTDSDNDTYGWTDDLEQNLLEVMDNIENPPFSPLFV